MPILVVSMSSGTVRSVTKHPDRLLREIEDGALDGSTSIADVLRKVIALGGHYRSPELRDWAARELNGYEAADDLPEYRKIAAPLQIDALMPFQGQIRGQQLSALELPDYAPDYIKGPVALRQGIGELEVMAKTPESMKLQAEAMPSLVALMNRKGDANGTIMAMYWSVHPTALAGLVDRVRTMLTTLIAELVANTPPGSNAPTPGGAANAVQFVVTGQRNKINIVAPQDGSTVQAAPQDDERGGHWWKIAGAVIGGVVAIAAMLFTIMQAQGWQF